jgi:hypothetical protein
MPSDDPDDEQVGLIAASNFDSEHKHEARQLTPRQPSRRKRVISACTVLVLLLLPFLFLLWMTTWVAPPHQEQPDTFALNPKFDQTAPPQTRVYRWTVSAVPVSGADVRRNRTRVVVNGRSPGPLIEANAYDRILVNTVLFLGLDFSKFFSLVLIGLLRYT